MVIRLAKEQGLLNQRNLTPFQHFALIYFLAMDRKQKMDDEEGFIKHVAAVMNPVRFREVYLSDSIPMNDFNEAPGYEVQPEDFSEIDRYLNSLDKTRMGQG